MEPSITDKPRSDRGGSSGHVGALLRQTRERLGEPLDRVAEALRIRRAYLEAIEAGHYDSLPGGAYAIGFVRAYADHLGLHPEEVVRRYKDESQSPAPSTNLEFPMPVGEGGVPAGALVGLALVLAACAYGAWYWVSSLDRPVAELIPDIPEHLAALVGPAPAPPPVAPEASPAPSPLPAPPLSSQDPAQTAPGPDAEDPSEATPDPMEASPPADAEPASALGALEDPDEAPPPVVTMAPLRTPLPAAGSALSSPAPGSPAPVASAAPPATSPQQAPLRPHTSSSAPQAGTKAPAATPPQTTSAATPPQTASTATPPQTASTVAPPQTAPGGAPQAASTATPPPKATIPPQAPPAPTPAPSGIPAAPQLTTPPAPTDPEPSSAPATPAAPVPDAEVGQPAPEPVRAMGHSARVVLRAASDSWIMLRKDGKLVVRRLLRKDDVYAIPESEGLTLSVSNAGALEVYVDGARAPSLSTGGTIRLDPNRLKSGR